MIKAFKTWLLALLQNAIREVECPKCRYQFQPFAEKKLESFAQLLRGSLCPRCGKQVEWSESRPSTTAAGRTPPAEQPANSRIERRVLSETELLYHLPASGRWGGGLFFFAIVWNLVSIPFLSVAVYGLLQGRMNTATAIAVTLSAIGGVLAYASARTRFATHLIYLSAETVRVQRAFLRRKNYVLETAGIRHVKKVEIYKQNYQPVFAIEIAGADDATVRFGSILTEAEKEWFCFDATTFLRRLGAAV